MLFTRTEKCNGVDHPTFNHHRLDLSLRCPSFLLAFYPSKSLFASLRACHRHYVDRPPSLADATSACPSIPVSRPHHTRCAALASVMRDHISPDLHLTVLGLSFVRFPIAFSFRIPALPLLLSIFYIATGNGTTALPLLA